MGSDVPIEKALPRKKPSDHQQKVNNQQLFVKL